MIVLADRHELFADDTPAGVRDVFLDRLVGQPWPDIVAADQIPVRRMLGVGEPLDGRAPLRPRRLADGHDAGRSLAALIDRRVKVGNVSGDDLAQRHPDRADMRAHHEVCVFGRDDVGSRPRHVVDIAAGVMERDFNLAAENAAAAVDLGNAQQRTVDGGRAPDSRRTGQSDKIGNPQFLAVAARHETGASAGSGAARPEPGQSLQQPFRRHGRPAELSKLRQREQFALLSASLVRRDQTTIGKVIGNKNILVENIEYSTIPMHIEQARALNIHPKPPL